MKRKQVYLAIIITLLLLTISVSLFACDDLQAATNTGNNTNGDGTQDGFGIMLRDACFAPKQDSSLMSNYVAAGIYRTSNATNVNFSRSNLTSITKSGNTLTSYPSVNDTVKFTLTRTGQKVVVTTTYGGTTYTTEYLDFDFVAMDSQYFYLGMFGARGTVVEFTNVSYEKTGTSQGA